MNGSAWRLARVHECLTPTRRQVGIGRVSAALVV